MSDDPNDRLWQDHVSNGLDEIWGSLHEDIDPSVTSQQLDEFIFHQVLPVEDKDTIQDVLAFYIDSTWDDNKDPEYATEHGFDAFERAQDLYRRLTGFERVNGADIPT